MYQYDNMRRKTKKMKAVEEKFNQPLEKLLPEMIAEHGLSRASELLDVSKASLGYWILKLGFSIRRACIKPDEAIVIMTKEEAVLWSEVSKNDTGQRLDLLRVIAGYGKEVEHQQGMGRYKLEEVEGVKSTTPIG